MTLNTTRARKQLAKGDLRALFIEELGWDRHTATLQVTVESTTLELHALAQKRGMLAYQCPTPPGQRLPDYNRRRKIERQVAKSTHEHLIVFTDETNQTQIWQWVKREIGKPAACREHSFHRSQPGDALLQKLDAIAFTLEEEDRLSLPDVTRRAGAGFDIERVTKHFYDRFQKEHAAFLKFITGVTEDADREWYASVILNRLMFVYFIQRKGFLNGDRDYLRNRLARMRIEHGKDKFYSFYRYFLLRLFHEGLGDKPRTRELETLVGRIPYLNGGLFAVHELEKPDRYGETIQIPDQAFEGIFDYFDQYQWHLDERPLRADNEINPDVLGYIFEKYINQKQIGAYYTKEDITDYINRNTVLPFVFDTARGKCKVAFENAKGPTVWDLLRNDPDRYIYPAVRQGAEEALPPEIAAGLNPPTLHKAVGDGLVETLELRKNWNKLAPRTHALPTETWRDVVARRKRYEEITAKLDAGDIRDINDLVTLNLDICQFAQDAIESCEGPDLLRAFWHAIEKATILDPTCGSGAFLFAALNVLEPLYEACLGRMEAFVEDLSRAGEKQGPEKYSDFRKVLERVAAHPNRRYFIFKSIILNNLCGVDIMEEAVEICKLRLFLKLAAQVEPDTTRDNLGIEPLPDIDFNIRAGNALVGYATLDTVKQALGKKLSFDNAAEKITAKAADLQQVLDAFRLRQIEGDGVVTTEHKQELHWRLKALDAELNHHLAGEYGVDPERKIAFDRWRAAHQPFHWFSEFYGIMQSGGFDVIIGNPPWKEYTTVKDTYTVRGYETEPSGNLYAFCAERSLAILSSRGFLSFIVQLPIVSSSRMATMRACLRRNAAFIATITCDDRPGKLFEGLQHCRSTIFVLQRRAGTVDSRLWSSGYRRWASEVREFLLPLAAFTQIDESETPGGQFPKITSPLQVSAYAKMFASANSPLGLVKSKHTTGNFVFYQESAQYWIKATVGLPHYAKNGRVGAPAHGRHFYVDSAPQARIICTILHSSFFYSYYIAFSDCFHVSETLVASFPVPPATLNDGRLDLLGTKLVRSLKRNAERKTIDTKTGDKISYDEFRVGESKPIIDEIDHVLSEYYECTEEELDFITNYDIKYRN